MLNIDLLNSVQELDFTYVKKGKILPAKIVDRPNLRDSQDMAQIFRHYWNPDKFLVQEEFKVLYANRSNRVLSLVNISSGGLTGTVADPRLILGIALKIMAVSIGLCHNHPSGNNKPSRADEELTLKITTAAKYFDIKVLDHIILTEDDYFSFADNGLF